MIDTVHAVLGALVLGLQGYLFDTLAERVEFDLNNTQLQGTDLVAVADALESFIASPSFPIDRHLIGVAPHVARLNLRTMRTTIKAGRSLVL